MLLKYLDIQGFKSFPDKIRLSFTNGISAVVGPNGSGKSNISDAIRWVLGEQSTKNLRGSKMEDVVFFGTATRKAVGFAEVTLTVDNSDRRLDFEADEIAITRRYYRSGESEYKINGAGVRLRDIHEMLMDTGLGRDGYSIVSQGKITSVVDSRSDDRREIFEEAAGISKYRYRKNEAEKRLNSAEENLVRLRDILTELENQVGPLKEQSEKAQKFLELAGEKKELEIGLWLKTIDVSKDELREQNHKITLASSQHGEVEDEINELQAQIDESFTKSNQCTARIDEIRRESSEFEENAVKKESESELLKNNIFHNNESIARILREIEESNKSSDELNDEIEIKVNNIQTAKEYIEKYNSRISELNEQLENIRKGDSDFSGNIEIHSRELAEYSMKASDAKVKAVTCETQISEIKTRINTVNSDRSELEDRAKTAENEYCEAEQISKDLAEKIESFQNSAQGYQMRVDKRNEKCEAFKRELDELELDYREQKRRAKMLEDMEKNLEGFSYAVKTVMKQADNGFLRGIRGPVSRVITATKEYSTAIETALGAAMQNIVVETEEDAKRAISYLKKNDGGRATFLPMSSIKGNRLKESGLDDMFGFVGIAADLVTYDKEYSGIVDSLLGRTAVAEDIDCAVTIARKYSYKFRIVTLDGQVINAGGSLTGGSAVKSAHLISRRNEIETLKKNAEKTAQKIENVQISYRGAKEESAAAVASLNGTLGELKSAQEDKIRFDSEMKRLDELSAFLKKNIAELTKEAMTAEGRIIELENQMQKSQSEADDYAQKISVTEKILDELTGSRRELTEKREALTSEMQEIKLSIVSSEKEIENLERSIDEIKVRIGSQKGRIEQMKKETDELEIKNRELETQANEFVKEAERLKEAGKASLKRIEDINNERMALEKLSVELRTKERDKAIEKDVLSRELAKLEEQKISISRKCDEIIHKLWEEYELTYSAAQEQAVPVEDAAKGQRRLAELKNKIKLIGSVNVSAIEQYKEVSERYELMRTQVDDVEKSKAELLKMINEFTKSMRDIFTERFDQINSNFSEIFKELFGGGTASFSLTDPDDILNSGIEIKAQPPGKNIAHLESLSGGEKSLIAIAIYFAIMKVNPTPFCVLDEIEAALDDVNVDRYAAYLRRMSSNTQFIVITHRRGTMEEADVIYGVTMQNEGVSKLLELNLTEAKEKLGI